MGEDQFDSSMAQRPQESTAEEIETPLVEFFITLAKHKKMVLGFPLLATFLAGLISLLLPNWYTAITKIMPPQQSQSNAVAILGQLGAIAGGASQALGLKNPSDIYVAMLKSRTVADRLIDRFQLKKAYNKEMLSSARRELARNSFITAGREGVITIEVDDKDPKRAADIANAYIEELRGLTVLLAVGEASQRRVFFEGQLKKAKNDLTAAETELKKFTVQAGLVNPQGQIGLSVAAAASLRAQVSAKEIQLAAMRSFATDNNPDVMRTLHELNGLRVELAKMEKNSNGKGDVLVPFGKAPEVGLEYTRRYRDMKYYETLYEVLAKQYEIARIDEAKDATLIQVLDSAVAPERKSKPKRWLIALIVLVLSLIASVVAAIIREAIDRAMRDPRSSTRLHELASLIALRPRSRV